VPTPGAKISKSLHGDDEKNAECWRSVVGLEPGADRKSESANDEMPKRRTNAAITEDPRQGEQGDGEDGAEEE